MTAQEISYDEDNDVRFVMTDKNECFEFKKMSS
jgi:hypothetical protein